MSPPKKDLIPTALETALLQLSFEQKQELLNWLLQEPFAGVVLEEYLTEIMK